MVIINGLVWCYTSVITDNSEKTLVYVFVSLYISVSTYIFCLSLTVSNLESIK